MRIVLVAGLLWVAASHSSWVHAADHETVRAVIAASGGDVRIPAGTYVFGETVELNLAKLGAVAIRGDGPVTIRMAAAGPALRIVGTHEGTASPKSFQPETWQQRMPLIDGLEILGEHGEADGIELVGTVQATLSRIAVRNARHGIHLVKRNRNVAISNCHLYGNRGAGLYLDDVDLHQINVANSHISYNRGGGIVVRGGNVRNLHVTGCDLEANMPDDDTPTTTANILLDQSNGARLPRQKPATKTDSETQSGAARRHTTSPGGLNVERKNHSIAEVAITGCTIQHSAHYGKKKIAPGGANIRIRGDERHRVNMVTITGNVLSDTTTHVHLDHVMDVTLTGNTFFTTEPTDLMIEHSQRVIVTGNAFNPREAGAIGGIVVRNSTHCLLTSLTLHNIRAAEGCIQLEECEFCRLSNCVLSNPARGISLKNCRHCVVSGCTISGLGGGLPVTVDGPSNVAVDVLRTP